METVAEASLISEQYQKEQYLPSQHTQSHITTTASGSFDTSLTIGMRNIRLPEFSNGRKVDGWNCRIFDSKACQYDMILGRVFMHHIGINNFFSTDTIRWINCSVNMKSPYHYELMCMKAPLMEKYESKEALSEAYAELFEATAILDQAYKKITPSECAKEQDHMTKEERAKFQDILERHKVLFDGELGLYPHKNHLKLKEGAVPVHKKPYPDPFTRQAVFGQELRNLVNNGVLQPCGLTN